MPADLHIGVLAAGEHPGWIEGVIGGDRVEENAVRIFAYNTLWICEASWTARGLGLDDEPDAPESKLREIFAEKTVELSGVVSRKVLDAYDAAGKERNWVPRDPLVSFLKRYEGRRAFLVCL